MDADSAFVRVTNASWRLMDVEGDTELFINLGKDSLWTDGSRLWAEPNPLAALRQVASVLGARVIGEDGDDLTTDEPRQAAAGRISGFQSAVSLFLLPFVLVFGLVLLIVRLPWTLWKIWRATRRR